MFICLSSGASPRYRQDILRALALPRGARLQFRYQFRWIAQGIRDQLSKGTLKKAAALIAYIDQHDNTKVPELVPCRFATITDAEEHGTTASFVLTVDDFAYSDNLSAFNTELQSLSGGTLPRWQPDGKIAGTYWLESSAAPVTVIRSANLADWERIVNQIAGYEEFASEKFFYTLQGVRRLGSSKDLIPYSGVFALDPGRHYECRIYHFQPRAAAEGTGLKLMSSDESLARFTTNTFLSIDSRYDLKRARLRTGRPARGEETVISVHRVESDQGSFGIWDFDLPLRVSGTFWQTLVYGIVLGALLASPEVVGALSNPSLSSENQTVIVIVASVAGLFAGVLAAFGLRRSV